MNPDSNEKEVSTSTDMAAKQDSIFNSSDADMSGYDKNLKTARVYLFIVAGFQMAMGIYEYNTVDEYLQNYVLAIDFGIGAVFLALALLSYKKPVAAFGTALVLYVLLNLAFIYFDPSNIYKGIIIKVLVVIALIKGLKDAREYEAMKKTFGGEITD